jgi:replication initiation protein RepC
MGRLRRRATIARNGITQILETAAEYGFGGEEWLTLSRETKALTQALKRVELPEEMTVGVESLERRQRSARERLEKLLISAAAVPSEVVDSDPLGPENRPHQYTYKTHSDPEQDTVIAPKECSRAEDAAEAGQETPVQPQPPQETRIGRAARTDSGTVMRVGTDELVQLAPRLRPYLRTSTPAWPEIVDAADWLRHDLGVSKSLWGDACLAMGREEAAIAIAIVSAKPVEYFTSSPGGYFHGMVAKAKAGELNLARTVWGLRTASTPGGSRSGAGRAMPRGAEARPAGRR